MCQRGASWSSTSSSSRCKQRNFSSQICPINPWLTCYFSLLCCSAYYTPHFSNKIAWGRKCGNSIFFFLRFASKFTVHCKRFFFKQHWYSVMLVNKVRDHPFKTLANFAIFDPYPLPSAFQQNAYEGDFWSLCTMTFGPSAHGDTPPPLRHADVLNGWSLID